MIVIDLTFYYPQLATWACADPTRVWRKTSMDQFICKCLFLIIIHTDFCCCSIDKTNRIAAAWFILLVGSFTLVGFAEAAFVVTQGRWCRRQEMDRVSLRRTASLNVLIFRSSVQSPNTMSLVRVRFAIVGVLKELNCDWPKELMKISLMSTHQLLILTKILTYTAEFRLKSGNWVINTLLHSLNYGFFFFFKKKQVWSGKLWRRNQNLSQSFYIVGLGVSAQIVPGKDKHLLHPL